MANLITALFVLKLAASGLVLGQGDKFFFSTQPKPVTSVASGQPVTLDCKADVDAGLIYYWEQNSHILANTTRRFQIGPNLHITRVDREKDAGDFTCIAANITSRISKTSQAARIDVQWLLEEVKVEGPENPGIGNATDVTLQCKTDGSGELIIDWYRNSEKIVRNERHTMKGKKLHIREATAADNGVFKCVTHNEAGTVDSTTNYALAIPGDGYPLARVFPVKQIAKKGESAKFDCNFENAEDTQWLFGSSPLVMSEKYSIHQNGSLVIHKVSSKDEGIYRCVGVAAKKVAYSAELQLAFLEPLTNTASLEPRQSSLPAVVAEKSEFEVTCLPPNGVPKPRVWWKAPNNHVISDSGPIRVDETRLIIDSARVENAGNYTCVAENLAGSSSLSLPIFVSTPPKLVHHPKNITVDEDSQAVLSCLFNAPPYPITTVRWKKDSGNGHFKYMPEDFLGRHNNGTLLFTQVQVPDRGTYQCEITTKGFKPIYSKKATIHVNEKLKFHPRPVSKKFELGSMAKLHCKAQGSDKPVIKWLKDNNARKFDFSEHIQDINGTLHFNQIQRNDKGNYTCVATNTQGIISATIEVDVYVSPKFIMIPNNPTEVIEGNSVMLHCVVEGDPQPNIQWDKDTKINNFDSKRITVLENNTLYISEVLQSDEARYACIAGNTGGFKREEVQLIVRSRDYFQNMGGAEEGALMTRTVTITLSAAAAYMLLVVGLMVWCRYRRLRRKQSYLQTGATPEGTLLTKAENGEPNGEKTELRSNMSKSLRDQRPADCAEGCSQSHSSNGSGGHKKSRSSYDKLSFPRQDLNKILTLGHGQFGEVFVAKAKGMRGSGNGGSDDEGVVVMVKALQTRDEHALHEFKREMDMYHKLRHEHIARLLGLCRDMDPHFVITEYTDWGDLKQLLLATTAASSGSKKDVKGLPPPLTMAQLVQLALQILRGMDHLASQRLTHKDLAARNILITSSLSVKIASIGLCKDTYSHEYIKHHDILKPIRWMPYEAVFEDDFSTKSDVWSFAVLFWEMVHAGETPQAKHPDDAVVSLLNKRELQWRPPKAAPEPLQVILRACWSDSPRDRPSFAELVNAFEAVCVDSQI